MPDALESLSATDTWLLAGAVASSVVWLVAVAVVYLARRPPLAPPGPATLDLGPEPPALANFLVHRFRVTREAVPATLLDLAARNLVEIEQREPGVYVVRLRPDPVGDLTDYERRVLEHLRDKESDGIVPTQALTTGPADESKRWWRRFQREVVADSKRRGLSRDLLDRPLFVALGVAAGLPALLAAVLGGNEDAGVCVIGVALAILVYVKARHTQRETPEGLAAASRWRGVREKLEENEVFPTVPPIAVALWERHLAYGAAFGIAPGAVRPIPMGAESDTRAWSSYGGRWRQVRVRYPHVYPFGWGEHPVKAFLRGAAMTAAGGFLLYLFGTILLDAVTEDAHLLVAAAILVPPGLLTALGATFILRALADSWSRREVTGEILRLRGGETRRRNRESQRRYVAVDDGRSDTIRAWVVSPGIYAGLRQGQLVTVSVTRHLGHVRSITPVARAVPTETAPLEAADLRPPSPA